MFHITPAGARRLALTIAGLNAALLLGGFILGFSFSVQLGENWLWRFLLFPLDVVVYSVLAVLVINRHPRHTVGWIFLITGSLLGLVILLNWLQLSEPSTNFGPVLQLAWWVSHLAFVPAFILPTSLMLLFFPDGRLPSRRWRPVAAAALLGMCGGALSAAFVPWPMEEFGIEDAHNPFAIAGSEVLLTRLFQLSGIFVAIGVVGSLDAVVVRYYRSQGVERTQIKWLAYSAVGSMLTVVFLAVFFRDFIFIAYPLFLSLPTLLAIAMAIAILRYRLYDIDLIIRRTLVYGALTFSLALVYFGSVLLLQEMVQSLTGQEGQSPLVIVVSTLLIAALFTPLRRCIQNDIDRRFYRRRYDAEKTLEAFAAGLRQEVDLEQISRSLLAVTAESMQPEHASLWLKPGAGERLAASSSRKGKS